MAGIGDEVRAHAFKPAIFCQVLNDHQNEVRQARHLFQACASGHVDRRDMSFVPGFGRHLLDPADLLGFTRCADTVERFQQRRSPEREGQRIPWFHAFINRQRLLVDIAGDAPPVGNEAGCRQRINSDLHARTRPHPADFPLGIQLDPAARSLARHETGHDNNCRHGEQRRRQRHFMEEDRACGCSKREQQNPASFAKSGQRRCGLPVFSRFFDWRRRLGHGRSSEFVSAVRCPECRHYFDVSVNVQGRNREIGAASDHSPNTESMSAKRQSNTPLKMGSDPPTLFASGEPKLPNRR